MRHNWVAGISTCLFIAAVIALGMIGPKILIERQEISISDNPQVVKMHGQDPVSYKEVNPASDISQKELVSKLSAWADKSGIISLREPYQNELSMDAAFSMAKNEMQKLMELGVIPNMHIQQYQLNSAELISNSASVEARWSLKFSYDEEQVAIEMDAETGKIYALIFGGPQADSISNQDRITAFALYYGIQTKEKSFNYDGDTLTVGSLLFQIERLDPPEGQLQVSLAIGIAE